MIKVIVCWFTVNNHQNFIKFQFICYKNYNLVKNSAPCYKLSLIWQLWLKIWVTKNRRCTTRKFKLTWCTHVLVSYKKFHTNLGEPCKKGEGWKTKCPRTNFSLRSVNMAIFALYWLVTKSDFTTLIICEKKLTWNFDVLQQ